MQKFDRLLLAASWPPGDGASTRDLRRSLHRLARDESGAVSLEFTVLVPFFVMLMVFFADATVIYLTHTEMFNAAREISRRASTGELQDQSQAQSYANSKLLLGERTYYVDVDFSGDNKRVTIAIPLYDAAIFGVFFRPILGRALVAVATTSAEPRI
jgi:Flp pilus assembly pilin Flp